MELINQKSDLDKTETAKFVELLFEEDKIAYDPEGWLVWIQ